MTRILYTLCLFLFSLSTLKAERTKVEIQTSRGTIIVALYNETPKHRDNFIKLVEEGIYDSLLFHRVIEDFMIQAGDIKSKNAGPGERLGANDLGYKVPAEFSPVLFHKKGVLAAARDGNKERASSSTQFYLVQGKVQNDSTLNYHQKRINNMLRRHYYVNDPNSQPLLDSMAVAREAKDSILYNQLRTKSERLQNSYEDFIKYEIPEKHRMYYKTMGGTPHLDQNYTVFGEIIFGFDVLNSIAGVETDNRDRPLEDVRIISMRVVRE